ncbi:hypothetical protein G6016_05245 [Dietzia aerolata]|uniref:LemA family protein n=1 Tax=Dietzia aerolata TaxID=595984 RepID=A0ABV5JR56_9ACTN|nr:hypothetical protein [Dietzia aerolata]MBB0968375.1 hypothetical protein [Dietzia aerolata]
MIRLVALLVVALVLLAVVAGWLGYTSWLVRSGIEDLARRRRLVAGVDPLQATTAKTRSAAEAAHSAALSALSMTVEQWYELRESRAVGTRLASEFPEIEAKAARDSEFLDALESAHLALEQSQSALAIAQSAVADPAADSAVTAGELVERTASVDALTLQLRRKIYEYRTPGVRKFGRMFQR